MDIIIFAAIGIISGVAMGFFGIAGGTNLLILLVPISFAAAIEYYRAGNVNIKAAIIIAVAMCVAAWFSSHIAAKINTEYLRLAFGLFVILMGIYISATTLGKILK